MNYILIYNDHNSGLHTLLMEVPFTGDEVEKILSYEKRECDRVEQLTFDPEDIPTNVSLEWWEPKGVQYYRQLLKRL